MGSERQTYSHVKSSRGFAPICESLVGNETLDHDHLST